MATGTYTVESYLLDRANIHDTVFTMMMSYDEIATSTLIDSVYTQQVDLDYTAIMGGEPQTLTSEAWAKSVEPIHSAHEASQHVVQDLLIKLPQPGSGSGTPRPDKCDVICLGSANFYKRNQSGIPCLLERRTGGRYDLELVRVKELEAKGQNPWRISKQKVAVAYMDLGAPTEDSK